MLIIGFIFGISMHSMCRCWNEANRAYLFMKRGNEWMQWIHLLCPLDTEGQIHQRWPSERSVNARVNETVSVNERHNLWKSFTSVSRLSPFLRLLISEEQELMTSKSTNEWPNECMDEWIWLCKKEYILEHMAKWINENEWVNEIRGSSDNAFC